MQTHLWEALNLVAVDRLIDGDTAHDIQIEYGQTDANGRRATWRVTVSLGDLTAVIENSKSTWLPTQAARLEILEAFDELCTQHLAGRAQQ